jgi:hypothetical protein
MPYPQAVTRSRVIGVSVVHIRDKAYRRSLVSKSLLLLMRGDYSIGRALASPQVFLASGFWLLFLNSRNSLNSLNSCL